jgi:hypothetical protein
MALPAEEPAHGVDWMVETIWTKLPVLPTQGSNQSPKLEPGTEFFAAETGR